MKKIKFFVGIFFAFLLVVSTSIVTIPIEKALAENSNKKINVDLKMGMTTSDNPTAITGGYKWSCQDFAITSNTKLITPSYYIFLDGSQIKYTIPSAYSVVTITAASTTTTSDWDKISISDNASITSKTNNIMIIKRENNNSEDVVLTGNGDCSLYIESSTFNDVGSLEYSNPIGGWINQGGKKSIAAFGFTYRGPTLASDSDFGIAIGTSESSQPTELINGTVSDLISTAKNGRFYCYKIDETPVTYYAKAFVKLKGVTYYTSILEVSGNLSGTEYVL